MNLKYKLISFATSLALIGTMAANALAEKTSTPAATVKQPTITLTTSTPNIQMGQSVEITLSIDAQKEGFAGLSAFVECDQAGLTPAKVNSSISDDVKKNFSQVRLPEKTDNGFSGLLLGAESLQQVQLSNVSVYTFTAEKVGTYTVSVSGDYSDASGNSTLYNAVSPLTITVSAKTLTASVSKSAMLTGTYGEAPSTLATHITKDMVNFSDNGKVVSVDGTWTYAGEAGSYPTVGTQKAAFLFTPNDKAQYAPLTVEIPVKITPKELTAALSVANASKQYDGTKKLPEGNLAVKLNGSVSSDKLTAAIQGTPEYDSANVGENIAIKAAYKVSGSNLGCYTLGGQTLSADAEYTAEASGRITPYTGVVTVSENFDTRSYNGTDQPLKPQELTLKDSYGNPLTAKTDYEVTYPDGCRGRGDKDTTVSYKLTGLNNYAGCTFSGGKGSFEIKQLPMPVATGQLSDVTVDYNTPFEIKTDAIRLSDSNGKDITSAGDLKLRYKAEGGEWTDVKQDLLPGTYTVGVYFDSNDKNAYASGMLNGITAQLVINKVAGSGTVTMEDYTYGDDTPAPVPTSTTNGTADVSYRYTGDHYDSDKAPVNAGNYTVTATFKATEIYNEAAATDSFTVSPKKLTDNDVKFSSAEFTYNGEVQKPELQTSLTAEDYTAVYSDESSKIVGSYTVTVTGKGNYTGRVTCTYTIKKASGSGSVTMADYTYGDKAAPKPVPTSATNGTGTDQVSYHYTGDSDTGVHYDSDKAPTNAGSYTVTASFKESANATECTATANFTVHPKGLVADKFTLSQTEFTYNGEAQKPTVSAAEGTDYTVKYPDASTNAGSYKVTVTGKGNYTGTVELSYKINPAVYKLPEGAKITTELETYPLSIYGGQPLSHIGLKATGLPEGAQFGWSAEDRDKTLDVGTASYQITVDPNDPNYSAGTATVNVTLAKAIAPADSKEGITGQLSTVAASISKTASENGKLSAGASADIAKLTRSDKLTPKEQDDLKSAHLSDIALLDALDKSAENVTVSTQLNKGEKSALTGLAITTGGKAALGESSGTATYTAKDITPEKPADGQLIEVELSLSSGQQAQQPAVPVLVNLSFNAKNADPNGKFQVVHKHTETDASKNFTTQYDCRSVSKSGDTVTVQFLAASFSSFSIQYTAPASGGSSSSSSATPKPDEPQPQPTAAPALTASETTWLGGYGALLNAKSGTALSLDVTACEYLPGYIITGVQKSGVTLNLSTPAGKLCLSPAVAKAMNGSYNYTFADALAIAGKVAAAAKPAASPAPVKDPTAASPTPAPTPVPTAAPQPTQAPAPQPEAEPQEKSHSPLPMVAAVLVAAALLAGGYLAYNSASRRKALHDVYAPSKKVKLSQNQNNGRNRK